MIVFGVCVGPTDRYERIAGPGLDASRDSDSVVVPLHDQRSIANAYNLILDRAAAMPGVEAVVFIHDDVRLSDPDVCDKVRTVMREPHVAIVGVIGSRNPTEVSWASGYPVGYAIEVCGPGAELRIYEGDPGAGTHEVDTVDGVFLALLLWAIRHLRFDRWYPGFDGYDADICAQARRAGKRVMTIDLSLEHVTVDRDRPVWRSTSRQAVLRWRAKWRTDQPMWRRTLWRMRARWLPLEFRLRGIPWHK